MTDRRGFLAALLALAFAWKARRVHRPEEPVHVTDVAMGDRVRWMTDLDNVPTVGRVIGIQQRFRTTALRQTHCHVDFGTTRLWIPADSLRVIDAAPCWDCGEVLFDNEQEAREVAAGLQCWTCFNLDTGRLRRLMAPVGNREPFFRL